uniref:Uncharacterized protein n=1 Tax=viral metagenome TaxID=1070528 RepID=A0A6M3LK68_9ZZZZ
MSTPNKSELQRFEQIKMEFWMNVYISLASRESTAPSVSECSKYYASQADAAVYKLIERFDPRNKQKAQSNSLDYLDGQEEFNFERGPQ